MDTLTTDEVFSEDPDRHLLARIHQAAHQRFGGGVGRVPLLDFATRLDLVRAVLRLQPGVWDNQTVGQILQGGVERDAGISMSKIKSGTKRMDAGLAAMLAALVNYLLCVQPECSREVSTAQRLDVLHWVLDASQQPAGLPLLSAREVVGDLLEFAQRLLALADAHGVHTDGVLPWADAHAVIIEHLLAPIDHAVRDQRLLIERERQRAQGSQRFGAAQRPGGHPRSWPPVQLEPGDRVTISLPRRAREPLRGWLLTVRDALPSANAGPGAPWVWSEGWERSLRWLPGTLRWAAGDDVAVPADAHGEILPLAGRYQVFLFTEPDAQTPLTQLLRSPGDPQALGPDEYGYERLLEKLPGLVEQQLVQVYAGSYAVAPVSRAG
jgi:hypothetical protein